MTPSRPVDRAMQEDRQEKQAMRQLWVETVQQVGHAQSPPALYLTLPGADGRDIQKLVDDNVLRLTESGAVHDDDKGKVLAVESSPEAVLQLQRRFPGLRILEGPIHSLVRGEDPTVWPQGSDREHCRARVINLDLNSSLTGRIRQGQLRFPILDWISKLAQLHAATPHVEWHLLLTLHAQIEWSSHVNARVRAFLADNIDREHVYGEACRELLGDELWTRITERRTIDFSALSRRDQQHVLMAFVPKKISQLVHPQGWRVMTTRNLRYGGQSGRAPMVTWIIRFVWDTQASDQPDVVYNASLRAVLAEVGKVEEDGSIS